MLLVLPGALLLAGLLALYRARMGAVPWGFLSASTVIVLQGAAIETFGVQAGAEVGSSSLIVMLGVVVVGFFVARPAWRLVLAAIVCVLGAISSLVVYEIAWIYFEDVASRIDENPILLLPAAALLVTIAVATASDLPTRPRLLIAAPIALVAIFPITRIGEALEPFGLYLVYAAAGVTAAGWIWLAYSLRGKGTPLS